MPGGGGQTLRVTLGGMPTYGGNGFGESRSGGREALWAMVATLVLVVRILATIATAVLVIGWVVVSVRSSLLNAFLWPAVISATVLIVSTYLYSFLRPRHPRRNGWIP